jgi:hypothetical protein
MLASELLVHLPELNANGYSCEERLLCVLATFKRPAPAWEYKAFMFQRGTSVLRAMFSNTLVILLNGQNRATYLELLPPALKTYVRISKLRLGSKF